jgi:diguanylate cyclase (GGDEF)-like protein/PAS domain S-box-containing protein
VAAAVRETTGGRRVETSLESQPEAARENIARFFSLSLDLLCIASTDGYFKQVNPAWKAVLGYEPDELVGQPFMSLIHPDDREATAAEVVRLMGGAVSVAFENRYRCKDGSYRWLHWKVAPLPDQGLMYAVARDNTDRKRIEAKFESLLEAAPDAMLGVDQGGVIRFVNRQSELLFGYARDALVGAAIETLVPESSRKAHPGHRGRYFADPEPRAMGVDLGLSGRRRDGTEFPVDVSLSSVETEDGRLVIAALRDMTGREKAEGDRRRSERLAAIIEYSGDAIIGKRLDGIITSWNPAAERMYGYSSTEIIGKSVMLLSPADRTGEIDSILARIRTGQPTEHLQTLRVRKDGTVFPVSLTVSPICDPDGTLVGASAIPCDVTEQHQAARSARSLAAAEELVRTVMASASIGIALTDLDGSFRVVNRSFCDLLEYDQAWFLAHGIDDIVHPDDAEDILRRRSQALAGASAIPVLTLRLMRADGATVWVRRVAVTIPGGEGQPNLLMVQVEDITAEYEAHLALAYQAFHDPLTGLHNRAWILDSLEADLPAARRLGTCVGALFVDLDNFKVVNESLGHAAGDEVLAAVAARIVSALGPSDRVGRFGGDEFVILVQDLHDPLEVEHCAERVSASIAADLQVQGHRIVPTASIGIATSTSTSTPDSLLRDADSALFRAKAAGRARWQFFDGAMHAQAVARLTVEDQLRDGITRGEFVVHYQPIVTLADAAVVGHEALVRWAHPTRGLLSPAEFLDVAEDTGLISAIGAQVLNQVCALLAARPDLPGPVSVNVSAVQLAAPDWLGGVRDTLHRHGVDPARLVIEVTETAVLSLVDSARNALGSLRRLGVGIHVDDFGTGYSSISVLRDLPVTGVKLDLRFVHDLTAGDSQANALAKGLSGLVNGLHLTGIAEGVQTQLQADILLAQGWPLAQGYLFGRPDAEPLTR